VKGFRAALGVGEFRALLGTFAINLVGTEVGTTALALLLVKRGAVGPVVLLFLATFLFPGLVGPTLVARLERFGVGLVLRRVYLYEAVLFLALAVIVERGAANGPILFVAFVDAVLAFVARSLTRSSTATVLVPRNLLAEGKAGFNLVFSAGGVVGPALAGVIIVLGSFSAAFVVDSVSFLLAAAIVACAPGLADLRQEPREHETSSPVLESISYVWRELSLRALLIGQSLALVLTFVAVPATVFLVSDDLDAGAGGYAAVLTIWSIGMVIGSLLQARFARHVGIPMILAATGAMGVGYSITGSAPDLTVACLGATIGGVGNGAQMVSVETRLHQLVDERLRVRVTSLLESVSSFGPGLGIVIGGALTAALSPRAAYMVAGLGLIALVLAGIVRGAVAVAGHRGSPLPPGDSRENGDLSPVLNGGREPVEEANIFAPHVDVHEPA
jgi:hypothetical protein